MYFNHVFSLKYDKKNNTEKYGDRQRVTDVCAYI